MRLIIVISFLLYTNAYLSARDLRCADRPPATKFDAATLIKSIEQAEMQIKSEFGADVFEKFPDLLTSDGMRTIGEVWSRQLTMAGYPAGFVVRQCIAADLIALGMDDAAGSILVSGQANTVSIRHLKSELRKIK